MIFLLVLLGAIAFGVFSFLFVKLLIKYMETAGGNVIGGNLDDAEYIQRYGIVPPQWSVKIVERLRVFDEREDDEQKQERLKKRSRRRFVRKVRRLAKFMQNTSIVSDEFSRSQTVKALKTTGKKWRDQTWDELTGNW